MSKESSTRRERVIKVASGMTFLAAVAVAVLIVITQSQTSGGDTDLEGVAAVRDLLRGLPQHGTDLGELKARVELLEFGDLQCPVCKAYSETTLPQLVEGPVARGEARLQFQNFPIVGPESTPAGAAALAAGDQGRGWSFVELFYRNQGNEDSGYVTDDFLEAIAKGAGVPDLARWNRDRHSARVLSEIAAGTYDAENLGFTGTPSFAVYGPATNGKLKAVGEVPSRRDLESAISGAH